MFKRGNHGVPDEPTMVLAGMLVEVASGFQSSYNSVRARSIELKEVGGHILCRKGLGDFRDYKLERPLLGQKRAGTLLNDFVGKSSKSMINRFREFFPPDANGEKYWVAVLTREEIIVSILLCRIVREAQENMLEELPRSKGKTGTAFRVKGKGKKR
jgi:hypothetical protein